MSSTEEIVFFGTKVDALSRNLAEHKLQEFLSGTDFHHVTTPNTEMIMRARHDKAFQSVINHSSLRLPDGIGLVWFGKWLYPHAKLEKVSGADMFWYILAFAASKKAKVCLLTSTGGLHPDAGNMAIAAIKKRYPDIKIYTTSITPQSDVPDIISEQNIDIILVGLGAPEQDFWIDRNKNKLSSVRLAMGVGASIDFAAGVQKRAPKIFRATGLEWLWRLILQPSRIKRQLAIPKFMFLMLLVKLHLIKNR